MKEPPPIIYLPGPSDEDDGKKGRRGLPAVIDSEDVEDSGKAGERGGRKLRRTMYRDDEEPEPDPPEPEPERPSFTFIGNWRPIGWHRRR